MNRWEKNELQHAGEFDRFVNLLIENGVTSYLEIGSRWGGSLWGIGSRLPPASRLMAVERDVTQELRECANALRKRGQIVNIVYGDSKDEAVIETVMESAPFHAVLIDGAHDTASVEADYKNYGGMGRLVAFHDVIPGVVTEKKPWKADVARFFASIEGRKTIIHDKGGIGFGIVWR